MLRRSWSQSIGISATAEKACSRILVVNGNPDPRPQRFCAALCDAYEAGARSASRPVQRLDTGSLDLTVRSPAGDSEVELALDKIRWATRFAVFFPLWLDAPPVALRALFERSTCREKESSPAQRAARIVITMEMPAFAHRAMLRGERTDNGLKTHMSLPGLDCLEETLIGGVDTISAELRSGWLRDIHSHGTRGA